MGSCRVLWIVLLAWVSAQCYVCVGATLGNPAGQVEINATEAVPGIEGGTLLITGASESFQGLVGKGLSGLVPKKKHFGKQQVELQGRFTRFLIPEDAQVMCNYLSNVQTYRFVVKSLREKYRDSIVLIDDAMFNRICPRSGLRWWQTGGYVRYWVHLIAFCDWFPGSTIIFIFSTDAVRGPGFSVLHHGGGWWESYRNEMNIDQCAMYDAHEKNIGDYDSFATSLGLTAEAPLGDPDKACLISSMKSQPNDFDRMQSSLSAKVVFQGVIPLLYLSTGVFGLRALKRCSVSSPLIVKCVLSINGIGQIYLAIHLFIDGYGTAGTYAVWFQWLYRTALFCSAAGVNLLVTLFWRQLVNGLRKVDKRLQLEKAQKSSSDFSRKLTRMESMPIAATAICKRLYDGMTRIRLSSSFLLTLAVALTTFDVVFITAMTLDIAPLFAYAGLMGFCCIVILGTAAFFAKSLLYSISNINAMANLEESTKNFAKYLSSYVSKFVVLNILFSLILAGATMYSSITKAYFWNAQTHVIINAVVLISRAGLSLSQMAICLPPPQGMARIKRKKRKGVYEFLMYASTAIVPAQHKGHDEKKPPQLILEDSLQSDESPN